MHQLLGYRDISKAAKPWPDSLDIGFAARTPTEKAT